MRNAVRELRREEGLSQQELAEAMDVSRQTINSIETERYTPSLPLAMALARDPHLLETSVPGIFACGDVRSGPVKRVAAAVGEGSMAIAFVHQYLRESAVGEATPRALAGTS